MINCTALIWRSLSSQWWAPWHSDTSFFFRLCVVHICLDYCHLRNDSDQTTWVFCTSNSELIRVTRTHSIKFVVLLFVSVQLIRLSDGKFNKIPCHLWSCLRTDWRINLALLFLYDFIMRHRTDSWLLPCTHTHTIYMVDVFHGIFVILPLDLFCIRLICFNGVDSTVIRLDDFSLFPSGLSISPSYLYWLCLFAHSKCAFYPADVWCVILLVHIIQTICQIFPIFQFDWWFSSLSFVEANKAQLKKL